VHGAHWAGAKARQVAEQTYVNQSARTSDRIQCKLGQLVYIEVPVPVCIVIEPQAVINLLCGNHIDNFTQHRHQPDIVLLLVTEVCHAMHLEEHCMHFVHSLLQLLQSFLVTVHLSLEVILGFLCVALHQGRR
jgi:hypothetical protein